MKKAVILAAALAAALPHSAAAQGAMPETCAAIPEPYTIRCVGAVQAAAATQAQLGLLIAGGSPALAAPRQPGGPRLRASGRTSVVRFAAPRIIIERNPQTPEPITEEMQLLAVSASAEAAFAVTGGLDLLAGASFVPLDLASREGFHHSSSRVAWGAGARAQLLRPRGAVPGLQLSAMYRDMGRVLVGRVCERGEGRDPTSTTDPPGTLCSETGDVAQAVVGVAGVSTRAVLNRRLGAVDLGLGGGYDRFEGDFHVAVIGRRSAVALPAQIHRTNTDRMTSSRFSGFVSGAYAVRAGTVVAEAGWMQGSEPVPGFGPADFDPRRGTPFFTLGGRLGIGAVGGTPTVPAGRPGPVQRPAPNRRRDVITREEIVESGVTNLYDAVQRLRPAWLRGTRASNYRAGGMGYVVYQDNTPLGGLEALRELLPGYAEELRFLDGPTASNTLPGLGSRRVAGAIVIVTPGKNP